MAQKLTAKQEASLRIDYVPLDEIARFDKNPKKHDVGALVTSIRRYGFRDAPIFDGTLKALVAGHGRLKALESMKGEGDKPPAGIIEHSAGQWLVPVQMGVDAKSAAEAKAFLIDHNTLTLSGGDLGVDSMLRLYDQGGLEELLRESGPTVSFDGDDIDELINGKKEVVEDDPSGLIDAAKELEKKWGTKLGQLWILGGHRLLCGDSTKDEDVARVMGEDKPALMVTDPPYGVEYDADWRNHALRADGSPIGGRAIGTVKNDDKADWTAAWLLFSGDVAYVWHAGRRASEVQRSIETAGFAIRCQIIWAKQQFAIGRGDYHWKHEPCWYAVRVGKPGMWGGDRSQTTLWEIDKPHKSETGHSTQKPIECMARPIRNHDSEFVYDPFSGSGTTIIACEQLHRKCRAIEIDPGYVAVTLQRWADATGKEPKLEG